MEGILEEMGLDPRTCRWTPVAGGDIHQAFRVTGPDGPLFIKTNSAPPAGIFASEARGLRALARATAKTGLLGVPEVIAQEEHFLALEWIEATSSPALSEQGAALLGEGLAALHGHSSPAFGWEQDNWIGTLPQDNAEVSRVEGAGAFFASRRLQVQARLGREHLGSRLLGLVDRLCERIGDFIDLPGEVPALVHGDLWGGNWMAGEDGRPWIFDPATHYGCREAELAFTELFGGFPSAFYEAYQAHRPLEPGYKERVDLWNLYPLLVHANLFGGGYGARAERILDRVLR